MKESLKSLAKYQGPLIVYAVLIFLVSSLPRVPAPDLGIDYLDKILHTTAYSVFAVIAVRAAKKWCNALRNNKIYLVVIVFLVSALYAASDEYHQSFVPGRSADVNDFYADLFGIILALGAYVIYAQNRHG